MADPTSIPNLSAWWRADSLSLSTGTGVSSWADSSGNGFTATQGTSGAQPLFQTNRVNGLPVLEFDGSNDTLVSSAPTSALDQTVISVIRPGSLTKQMDIRGGSGNGAYLHTINATGKISTSTMNITGINEGVTTLSSSVFQIITTDLGDDTGTILYHYYLNGTLDQSGSTGATPSGARTTVIGYSNGTRYLIGELAELVTFERVLTTGERAQEHSRLSDKYGITVSDYVPPADTGARQRGFFAAV